MTMDNNRIDSPSKANQYQDKVVQAFFESLALTLEGILHSAEALEPTLSTLAERRDLVKAIACVHFQKVNEKAIETEKFQQSELDEFRNLRSEFFRVWKSFYKP